jgi:hypothetical protein
LGPVDLSQYPDYKSICPKPRDLGTTKLKVESNGYNDMDEFADDVRLCFNNGIAYNKNVKVLTERKIYYT